MDRPIDSFESSFKPLCSWIGRSFKCQCTVMDISWWKASSSIKQMDTRGAGFKKTNTLWYTDRTWRLLSGSTIPDTLFEKVGNKDLKNVKGKLWPVDQRVPAGLSNPVRPIWALSGQFYLICCGQFFPIGGEGDQTSSQVNQTADVQVRAAGGGGADGVCCTNHVAVAPLDTAIFSKNVNIEINLKEI